MAEKQQDLGKGSEGNITQILNKVETTFSHLMDERRARLGEVVPSVEVTRHHWDAANIMFYWKGEDSVDRNLNVYFAGPGEHAGETRVPVTLPTEGRYDELVVEANAWKDLEHPDGSGNRSWHGEVFSRLRPSARTSQLRRSLQRAYETVSSWREDNLTQQSPLQPFPRNRS